MSLGTEVDLGTGHNVLDGDPARPHFMAHFALARSTISATAELL